MAEQVEEEAWELDRDLERAVLRWQVAAALARLSPEHRQVIRLAHWGGLSLREIAERSGVPIGTVKSQNSLALRRLRELAPELADLVRVGTGSTRANTEGGRQ